MAVNPIKVFNELIKDKRLSEVCKIQSDSLLGGNVEVQSEICDLNKMKDIISENLLKNSESWVMYADSIVIDPKSLEDGKTLLEGEVFSANTTYKFRMISVSRYSLDKITFSENKESSECCYTDKQIVIRKNLISDNCMYAKYRLWYKSVDGRWTGLVQQFLGFIGKNKGER